MDTMNLRKTIFSLRILWKEFRTESSSKTIPITRRDLAFSFYRKIKRGTRFTLCGEFLDMLLLRQL